MLNVFITEGGKNQFEILVLICLFQKEFNFLQPINFFKNTHLLILQNSLDSFLSLIVYIC